MTVQPAKADTARIGCDFDASDLKPRDIIFVPRTGKRLVVETEPGRCFLDYPKHPRVEGSKVAAYAQELVPADPTKSLGWIELGGVYTVVHVRPLGEKAEAFRTMPVTPAVERRQQAYAELFDIYSEMKAINTRQGGRRIAEHKKDIQRRIDEIAAEAASMPNDPETIQLRLDIGQARAIVPSIGSSHRDHSADLLRLIGAIQNYDDDV